jgi:phosphoserine phosphatase
MSFGSNRCALERYPQLELLLLSQDRLKGIWVFYLNRFLVVFDVDSTLIQDEVIELLADAAGKRKEVAEVTERAMAGELDFAESLIERVATLQGLSEEVFLQVQNRISITAGVPETIQRIQSAGGKVGAVSGGFIQLLEPLAAELNLDFWRANTLEVVDGLLTGKVVGEIIDRSAKARALAEWSLASGLTQTVAVGDGANDLEMMANAGISVAFNAKQIVREQADQIIEGKDMRSLLDIIGL